MEFDPHDSTQRHWDEESLPPYDITTLIVVGFGGSILLAGVLVSLGLAVYRYLA